ncbi:MAG: serine/threonine-protein kinase [Myxococcota bacterium]
MSERFGSYTLLERIGLGGMAEVFLARRAGVEGFEKDLVIKRIRPNLSATQSFVDMFLTEAKIAAQLTHPNIVQIYDLGKIEESYFIAMEYIAGRDMSVVVPQAKTMGIPFPIEYALKIVSSVCEALYYAHTQTDAQARPLRIVHRDVSPENIRVAWTGGVKILDFGIAKAANQLHHTKAGEIKGKLSYMSPEQIMGKDLDHRSDIFSLGAVLYECITGLKLFSGENELAIMNNIVDGKTYPPSYFRDDVPHEVEAIVMKALQKERKRRYQSAIEMQLDIDRFLASQEFTPSAIHLSNFLKQIFREEIAEEQQRRARQSTPPGSRAVRATPPPPPAMTPLPAPPMAMQASEHGQPQPIDAAELEALHSGVAGLTITFNPTEMQVLRRIARQRERRLEDVVREMVGHYLQYSG